MLAPRSWIADPERCRAADLPEEIPFATRPELAARTVTRFLDTGHRAAWAAGDEVYDPKLRTALEERSIGYVLAVACSHEVAAQAGEFRADALAEEVPRGPGRSCRPGPERRTAATTTGPSSTSPALGPGAGNC